MGVVAAKENATTARERSPHPKMDGITRRHHGGFALEPQSREPHPKILLGRLFQRLLAQARGAGGAEACAASALGPAARALRDTARTDLCRSTYVESGRVCAKRLASQPWATGLSRSLHTLSAVVGGGGLSGPSAEGGQRLKARSVSATPRAASSPCMIEQAAMAAGHPDACRCMHGVEHGGLI